jgi:hypothetical protein
MYAAVVWRWVSSRAYGIVLHNTHSLSIQGSLSSYGASASVLLGRSANVAEGLVVCARLTISVGHTICSFQSLYSFGTAAGADCRTASSDHQSVDGTPTHPM